MLSLSEKMQASTFLVVYSVVVCFLGVSPTFTAAV